MLGDGCCDSPGYNAKYETYTIMDQRSGKIIDLPVSHVGMTANSSGMELEGLKHNLERLDENRISVNTLTTNRHKQVRTFLRKERKDIRHQFDILHVSKVKWLSILNHIKNVHEWEGNEIPISALITS